MKTLNHNKELQVWRGLAFFLVFQISFYPSLSFSADITLDPLTENPVPVVDAITTTEDSDQSQTTEGAASTSTTDFLAQTDQSPLDTTDLLPPLPPGWTRAKSNPNYAFRLDDKPIDSVTSQQTLRLLNLMTGEEQILASVDGSISQVYDVSPEETLGGPVVVYEIGSAFVEENGGRFYEIFIQRVSNPEAVNEGGEWTRRAVFTPRIWQQEEALQEIVFIDEDTVLIHTQAHFPSGTLMQDEYTVTLQLDKITATRSPVSQLITPGEGLHIDQDTPLVVQPENFPGGRHIVFVYDASEGLDRLRSLCESCVFILPNVIGGQYTFADAYTTPTGRQIVSIGFDGPPSTYDLGLIVDPRSGEELHLDGVVTAVTYDGSLATYTVVSQSYITTKVTVDLETLEILRSLPPEDAIQTRSNPNFYYTIGSTADGEILILYEVKPDGTLESQILAGPTVDGLPVDVIDFVDVSPPRDPEDGNIVIYSYKIGTPNNLLRETTSIRWASVPERANDPNAIISVEGIVSSVFFLNGEETLFQTNTEAAGTQAYIALTPAFNRWYPAQRLTYAESNRNFAFYDGYSLNCSAHGIPHCDNSLLLFDLRTGELWFLGSESSRALGSTYTRGVYDVSPDGSYVVYESGRKDYVRGNEYWIVIRNIRNPKEQIIISDEEYSPRVRQFTLFDSYTMPSGQQIISVGVDTANSDKSFIIDSQRSMKLVLEGTLTHVQYQGALAIYTIATPQGETQQVLVNLDTFQVLDRQVTAQILEFYGGAFPEGVASISWKEATERQGQKTWTISVVLNPSASPGTVQIQILFFKEITLGGPIRLNKVVETDSQNQIVRRSVFLYGGDGSLKLILRYNASGTLVSVIRIVTRNGREVYELIIPRPGRILGEVGTVSLYEVFRRALASGG